MYSGEVIWLTVRCLHVRTGTIAYMYRIAYMYARQVRACTHRFTALHRLTMHSGISHEISVCLSILLDVTNAWIVIKRKKLLAKFLHHIKVTYI